MSTILHATRCKTHKVEFGYDEVREALRKAADAPYHARVYLDDGDPYDHAKAVVIWDTDHEDISGEVVQID